MTSCLLRLTLSSPATKKPLLATNLCNRHLHLDRHLHLAEIGGGCNDISFYGSLQPPPTIAGISSCNRHLHLAIYLRNGAHINSRTA
jgi:hypothetical protein